MSVALAHAFLDAYAWPVLDPRLDADVRTVLKVASWTVWAAFVVDFGARLYLTTERLNRSAVGSLVGKVSAYVTGTALMALGLGAIAVLDAEQDAPGANITTFGDALWWSATTVTT